MQSYRPPTYFKQGRYHTLDVLGTGTYGQVIRCRDEQSGKEVAIKVAQQNQAYRLSALNEIRALQALQNCQDAVKMLDCFEEGGHVCIVTELLYKNLYDILRAQSFEPLDVHDIRRVALHLLRALTALHQAGYMHCDVKPENIMLRFSPATADDAMAQHQPPYNASLLGEQYSYYALQEQAVNFPYKSHGHVQANQPLPGNFAPGAATSLSSSLSYHTSSGLIESPRDDNSTSTLLSDDEPLSLLNMYTHATMTAAQPVSESAAHGFLSNGNKKVIYTSSAAATGPSPQPHNVPGTSATAPAAVSFDATCLIDFGAVRKFSENNYFDVQSLWYRAPEVLCELPYTISIDAWSVGCVLFELYTGKALFPGQNTQDQFARIVQLRGYPSQAALRARLSGHTAHTTTALSPRLGARVATESQVRRWMWRCRRQAYRTVRAKARQGTAATTTTTTTHTQEQIQVSLDELLNGQSKSDYAGPYNAALIAGDEQQQQQNDEEEDEMMDEVESDLLGLILALLEPDESHRLSCSAALMHPFLTRTYNGNALNSARLNFAPASYHHQQQVPTFQDANANNALWTHTTGAAAGSGPHTHTLGHPAAPHHHHLLPFHSNNTTNTSAGGVGLMYDEAQKNALPLPMMGTTPHTTLQASPHHTTLLSTMPHYTVMSTGPGMSHGQPGTTHALAPSEPQPSCNNGVYNNNNNNTSTTTATGATGAVPMMGNVGVMHSMNACRPSQSTNTTTATQGNPTMTTTAPMYGLVMQPTVNTNNSNSVTVGNNTTMAYGTQGMLQYQALHNPHNTNSNNSGNALNTPSTTTTTTTSMLDMSSPLYNLSTNSFTTVSQDVNRQQQQQQQQQQQHAMQCMAVNEQRSQSDGRLNGQAEMNHGSGAATTVFMPMAMSPVMYYQPVPMTLQAMQPRLELPGNNNTNSTNSGANNATQQTHVTYSTVMAAPGSMQPIATQPSQASSLYPCYVSTEQAQNYSGQYTNSNGNNMATSAPVRQDFDERTMQGGLMLQMPPVTTTLSNNNNNNNNQYSTQPHYSRVSGYSCIAQEGYGGRMDGMYYFNVSLPLSHQQTILLSSS